MKLPAVLAAALVLVAFARPARAEEPPPAAPEPYSLQVLGADAAAVGTLALSYAAYENASYRSRDAAVKLGALGMLGYWTVAPGIHMAHKRPFVGILDLALRVAPLGVGLALEGKGDATQSAVIFGGMGAVSAFDALVLARPGREGADAGGPDLAVMGAGAAVFGLSYAAWRAEVADLCRGSSCPRTLLGLPVVGPAVQTVRLVTVDGFTSCPWKEIGASACFLYPFAAAGAVVFYAGQAFLQLGGAGLVGLGAVAPWKKKTETKIGGLPVTMRLSVVGAGAGLAGEF